MHVDARSFVSNLVCVWVCLCVCVFAYIFAVFYLISVLGSSVQLCPTFCILVGSNKIYNNERTNVRANKRTYVRHAMPCTDTKNTHTQTHVHTANRHCNSKQQQPQSPQTIADWLAINTIAHTHTHAYILVSRQQKISPLSFSEEILTTTPTAVKTQQHNAHTVAVEQ